MRAKELIQEAFYHPYDDDLVKTILKKVPETLEIWFHGSRALGTHREDSDTDILVIVPESSYGDRYFNIVVALQKLAQNYEDYDIQPSGKESNIHAIAREEGELLWSKRPKKASRL